MRNRDACRRARRAAIIAPAIAAGLSAVPPGASAQTALPDINVIAPAPLSGHRAPKPRTTPAAPASQTAAPSEPAPAAANTDPTAIERDKVPSSTSVLTSTDLNHEYSPSFLDSLNRGLPGV